MKTTDELIQIALAGGGMKIDARMKTSSELVKIALAASNKKAQLTLVNVKMKTTQELIQIALAGRGCVVFDFVEE